MVPDGGLLIVRSTVVAVIDIESHNVGGLY